MVINADKATGEGEYLSEGNEDAAVNDPYGGYADTGNQQSAPEEAQDDSKE